MKEILTVLSDYQKEAMSKGISFDVDVYYNSMQIPSIDVKASYTIMGDVKLGNTITTSFSSELEPEFVQDRLDSIAYFLQTAKGKESKINKEQ